ncbi:integrating conjugative element protein [Pseudomonas lopnurensis]|uniref:integrating conjugative element protein n=1 Tax=Pseudomonas lopnurensis TaxID=1477517 RepID=UPI0028ACAC8B|nr:integrating conjugative element protein [Pseudomonas lopnurensis]
MTALRRILTASLLIAPTLSCAMTVVADHGGMPTDAFYENLSASSGGQAGQQPRRPPITAVGLEAMLPVTSELSPGTVEPRQVRLATLPAPLFIVGDDAISLRWLRQHHEALQRLQAIGWAVNVRDQAALNRIRAAVPGLAVQPMNVDDFARRLGLRHYPVMITSSSVEQ